MTEEELAAVAVALSALEQQPLEPQREPPSRWKLAARRPELGMEDLRALR